MSRTDARLETSVAARPPGGAATVDRRWRVVVSGAVADRLFPTAPERRLGPQAYLVAFAAVVLGALVSLLRQPGAGALDTAWAEDAQIFLADAVARPPLAALATAYEGYYHVAPRLLAEIAALFPPDLAATVMAVMAAAVTALLALFVYVAAGAHLRYPPLRLLASAPVVVAPLAQNELFNALCNLHWPLLYATFWALLWTPARRTGRVFAVIVVALTVSSDLLAAVFVPLALARLLLRRSRYAALLLATLVLGLGVQYSGLVLGHHPRDIGPPRLNPAWAVSSFVLRPVPRVLFGARLLPEPPKSWAYLTVVGLAWLVVLGAAVLALRGWTRANWVLATVLFVAAAALYCESVMAGGSALARYEYAPGLMILAGIAALLEPAGPPTWRGGAAVAVVVALVAAVCAANLRTTNMRAEGPSWQRSLRDARAACAGMPDSATVPTAISPTERHIAASLPCGYLRR